MSTITISQLLSTYNLTGYAGSFGYTGSQGIPGEYAALGYTGSYGYTGSKGDIGYVGSASTVIGYSGSQGIQGDIGYTGSTGAGYTGSASTVIGYTGSAGYIGLDGYAGSNGYTGSAGYAGSAGYTGSTGAGYTGSASTVIGYTGSIGVGYTGSAGATTSVTNGTSDVSVANNGNVTVSVSGNANIVTVTGTGVNVAGTLTVSSVSTLPSININRFSGNTSGITWYTSTYSAWTNYMAAPGNVNCGPYGNITAPTGNLITSWGLRSFAENTAGYGWTWESGTSTQTTPTVVAELRSSDGSFRNTGNIYCVGDVITNYSDVRLKDIVGPITDAVEKVCAIEVFYYRPNEIAKAMGIADGLQVGVSAQSAERVAGETVKPSPLNPEYKTVMYERLVPYLIQAFKDHEQTIQELKNEIKILKGQ